MQSLIPLLDGTRSASDLAQALTEKGSVEDVDRAVSVLQEGGFLSGTEQDRGNSTSDSYGRSVEVMVLDGGASGRVLVDALAALGIPGDGAPGFRIVVATDYLSPELYSINREAFQTGIPWMLVRPVGRLQWIGPIFSPGQTPCWECLAVILRANGWNAQAFKGGAATASAITESLAAQVVAQWLSDSRDHSIQGRIWEIDHSTPGTRFHVVRHAAKCPTCSPAALAARVTPEDLVSAATGIVMGVEEFWSSSEFSISTAQMSQIIRPDGQGRLLFATRGIVAGQGSDRVQSRVHCLGEAVERYSTQWHGDEERLQATQAELGDSAIGPSDLLLFSSRQIRSGNAPPAFNAMEPADWTRVRSLIAGDDRYVPTAYCYFGYGLSTCGADSNGCAAGSDWSSAVLRGLLELIERDAVAIWWYNRLPQPPVVLTGLSERVERLCSLLKRHLSSFYVLNLTHDLKIPVCAAVGLRAERSGVIFGAGSAVSPEDAVWRSLSELASNALDPTVKGLETLENWMTAPGTTNYEKYWKSSQPVPADKSLREVLHRLERSGLDAYVLNLTRPDIGIPVCRVISPGMRPWRPRFAPGRLYDVPVSLGRLSRPVLEEELNSVAFPL